MKLLLVEDNERLRPALVAGIEGTGAVRVVRGCATGEEALAFCLGGPPDAILLERAGSLMLELETFQWASRVVSLFNTIAMLWLGLTVLLNADRRRAGTWLAGGGLFFAAHSVFVGRQFGTFTPEMEFWWRAAWRGPCRRWRPK